MCTSLYEPPMNAQFDQVPQELSSGHIMPISVPGPHLGLLGYFSASPNLLSSRMLGTWRQIDQAWS